MIESLGVYRQARQQEKPDGCNKYKSQYGSEGRHSKASRFLFDNIHKFGQLEVAPNVGLL